jgi:intraflagellar transport protein 80
VIRYEDLEFKDRIIKMSLGFGHLVVATATQCSIYNVNNWNTPHIFDLKDTVNLIMQCKKQFLVVDNFNGITIYTYEGRQVRDDLSSEGVTPQPPGLKPSSRLPP